MIYLASPYSHPDKDVQNARYEQALTAVAYFAQSGLTIYSPIVHWHQVAASHDLPTQFEFWADQNKSMLQKANQLIVLNIEGWESSKGVKQEMTWAEKLNIPISFTNYK